MTSAKLMTRFEFDHFRRVEHLIEQEKRRASVAPSSTKAFVVRSGYGYFLGVGDQKAVVMTADPMVARRFEAHEDALDCARYMTGIGFDAQIIEVNLFPYVAEENS